MTLKVRFWHFLTPPHYINLQNSMISFDYSWFLAKNHSNFVTLPRKLHNRYCHNVHILIENIFLGHGNQMEVMENWLWLNISDQHISKPNHGIFRAFEMLQSENFCVLHWNFISPGPDCIPNSDLHFDERHWKSCGKFYWLAKWVGGIFTPTYPHRWQPNRGW